MSCELGKVVSRSVLVTNAGSMTANVKVELSSPSAALSAYPSSLSIQPGQVCIDQ